MRSAWVVMLAGCGPVTIPVVVPEPVILVGTVRVDGVEGGEHSAGLRRVSGGETLLEVEPDLPWLLVGYTGEHLASLSIPSDDVLNATEVRPTSVDVCWRLPPPSWSTPLFPSVAGRASPPLHTDWAVQCPLTVDATWFDVRCRTERSFACGGTVERSGCETRLTSDTCSEVATRIATEADGGACGLERPAGCSAEEGPDGGKRWRCANGCTFDFYPVTAPVRVPRPPVDRVGASVRAAQAWMTSNG